MGIHTLCVSDASRLPMWDGCKSRISDASHPGALVGRAPRVGDPQDVKPHAWLHGGKPIPTHTSASETRRNNHTYYIILSDRGDPHTAALPMWGLLSVAHLRRASGMTVRPLPHASPTHPSHVGVVASRASPTHLIPAPLSVAHRGSETRRTLSPMHGCMGESRYPPTQARRRRAGITTPII